MSTVYRIQCKKNWYHATFPSRWVWQSGSVIPMMIFQPSFFTLKALNWFEGRLSSWHPRVGLCLHKTRFPTLNRWEWNNPSQQTARHHVAPKLPEENCHDAIGPFLAVRLCVWDGWPSYIHLYNSPSTYSHKWLHPKTCFLQPNHQKINDSTLATYHPTPYNPIQGLWSHPAIPMGLGDFIESTIKTRCWDALGIQTRLQFRFGGEKHVRSVCVCDCRSCVGRGCRCCCCCCCCWGIWHIVKAFLGQLNPEESRKNCYLTDCWFYLYVGLMVTCGKLYYD